jgi:hypothetical protein
VLPNRVLSIAASLGIAAGVCLIIDSVLVDLPGIDSPVANTIGLLVPVLGVFLLVGMFIAVRARRPSRLLGLGFLLNTIGLTLVAGVDFSRTFVLSQLSDDQVDALIESGPTLPAFLVAGMTFVIGAVLFGSALARAGFAPRAAWLYVATAVPSGFAGLLPGAVGAVFQVANGVAIIGLGWALRSLAAEQEGVPSEAADSTGTPSTLGALRPRS